MYMHSYSNWNINYSIGTTDLQNKNGKDLPK